MRAGLYLRISKADPEEQTATKRQRADCEAFCKRNGWEVVDVFEDVDLSAYDRKVKRPEYERMIRAVDDREIDVVVAWRMDRLTRSLMPYAKLMEAVDATKAFIATADGVDTREHAGRFHADIMVSHARMSSAENSGRIKRKHQELAAAGKLAGYGKRSFGYRFNKETKQLEVVEEEAREIRAACRRFLDEGASVHRVLQEWIGRDIHAPNGRWQRTNFKNMICSARIAGCREVDGALIAGTWPAIIPPDTLLQVRNAISGTSGTKAVTARSYLLSGMCRCGICGGRMRSQPDNRGRRRYVCPRGVLEEPNCGGVVRMAEPVEELVKQSVIIALDGVDLAQYVAKPTNDCEDIPALITADEDKLADLALDYADGKVTKAEWYAIRDRINARLEANRKKLHKANGHGALARFVGAGAEVAQQWEGRDLDWQRSVIAAVVDHVEILPQLPGANREFNPDLIKIALKF